MDKKVKNLLVTLLVIVAIILALLWGFSFGHNFVVEQDNRARAIESASLQAKLEKENQEGSSEALIGETSGTDEDLALPMHVTKDTPGAVEIYIKYGDESEDVANQLKDKGIIDRTTPFNIVAKINGFDGKYQRGTHFVLDGMNYNEIMYNLSLPAETTWVTFPEGSTYTEMKAILKEAGVNFNEDKLDKLVNSPSQFTQFEFISQIPTDVEDRIYALEGYLFPDTYQFDLNVSEEEILLTILRNTDNKLQNVYRERAEQLGLSVDQVLTLASIIGAESGVPRDQYKISRVFYNRLNAGWNLESDATINYLRELKGEGPVWAASGEQLEIDSKYNTYKHEGLPPGPISNPGLNAISAALYPSQEDKNIYYFVATGDGGTAFARTKAEHEANIVKYKENWK